jgi:hypothetical protein
MCWELLAIQRGGGAKDRIDPGCGGQWCGESKERGEAVHEFMEGGGEWSERLLQLVCGDILLR